MTEQNAFEETSSTLDSNSKDHKYKKRSDTSAAAFSEDMFTGTGGFDDGSYLIPHSREHFYKSRQELSYLRNFYKFGLMSVYQDVFAKDINREYTGQVEGYQVFVEDCNNAKMNLDEMEKEAIRLANTQGVVYVVMDNYPESEQPRKRNEAIQSRKIPYIYLRRQTSVNWGLTKQDKFGNIEEIAFIEGKDKEGNVIYRVWTSSEWKDVIEKGDKVVVVESSTHNLGVLPVFPVMAGFKTNPVDFETVWPPYWDVCKVNFALFQVDSENRDTSRSSRFPILFVHGIKATSIGISSHSVLQAPDATNSVTPPQWIEPNPALYADARDDANSLVETIFQLFGQSGITGVKEAKSGVALEWEFKAQESKLKDTSMLTQRLDDWIQETYSKYTGDSIKGQARFPLDFQPSNVSGMVQDIDKFILMNPDNQEMNASLVLDAFKAMKSGDDSPETEAIIDKMLKNITDLTNSEGLGIDIDLGDQLESGQDAPSDFEAEAKAKLKASVGGVQGILAIQASVASGVTDYAAAIATLVSLYGFTETEAKKILGKVKKIDPTNAKPTE